MKKKKKKKKKSLFSQRTCFDILCKFAINVKKKNVFWGKQENKIINLSSEFTQRVEILACLTLRTVVYQLFFFFLFFYLHMTLWTIFMREHHENIPI